MLRRLVVLLGFSCGFMGAMAPVNAAPHCFGRIATIIGTPGNDRIQGTNSVDVIVGLKGADSISALGGDDLVCAGRGRDRIDGDHPDFPTSRADDKLKGGRGDDSIVGEVGNDVLIGKAGHDDLCDAFGADRSIGGRGRDRFSCPGGDDVFRGGPGTDTVDFSAGIPTTVDLRLKTRQETGWGNQRFLRIENLEGGPEGDQFFGNAAANFLWLSDSADVADGGGGPDRLIGGTGGDDLAGGAEDDVLDGRAGSDAGNGGPHIDGDRCISIESPTNCEF
jgi:Ca2+-binding RTX toxin-like protein